VVHRYRHSDETVAYFRVSLLYLEEGGNKYKNKLRGLMAAKIVPTFADRGCRVVSATDLLGRVLGFLDPEKFM
jgi:hypothetical protein